jgi:hypothetical protein
MESPKSKLLESQLKETLYYLPIPQQHLVRRVQRRRLAHTGFTHPLYKRNCFLLLLTGVSSSTLFYLGFNLLFYVSLIPPLLILITIIFDVYYEFQLKNKRLQFQLKLEDWVHNHGSVQLREAFLADRLELGELIEAIENKIFSPLDRNFKRIPIINSQILVDVREPAQFEERIQSSIMKQLSPQALIKVGRVLSNTVDAYRHSRVIGAEMNIEPLGRVIRWYVQETCETLQRDYHLQAFFSDGQDTLEAQASMDEEWPDIVYVDEYHAFKED